MSKPLTAAQLAKGDAIRASVLATAKAPAAYAADCGKCGGASHTTILAAYGHCLACQRATWA